MSKWFRVHSELNTVRQGKIKLTVHCGVGSASILKLNLSYGWGGYEGGFFLIFMRFWLGLNLTSTVMKRIVVVYFGNRYSYI